MQTNRSFTQLFRAALAAGALATTIAGATGVAYAEDGGHGHDAKSAPAAQGAQAAAKHGKHGEASLARRHGVAGVLTAVDTTANTLTVTTKQGTVTISVTKDTLVRGEDDTTLTLNDVKTLLAGAGTTKRVRVEANGEPGTATNGQVTFTANRVHVTVKNAEEEKDEHRDVTRVTGKVTVDLAVGTITVTPTTGSAVTLKIGPNTEVDLRGETTLSSGQIVTATFKTGTDVALRVKLRPAA